MPSKYQRHTCSIAVGNTPPREFRLFVAGPNETDHGTFLFDDEAARLVMAAAEKKGVELPIDVEHQMLDDAMADPNARDARGWFRLEVRNGELWATDVRWSPDGDARLREKRQRYVSPAFETDPKTQRITRIINCAITALPATHNTPALIAAAARGKKTTMSKTKLAMPGAKDAEADKVLRQIAELLPEGALNPDEEPSAEAIVSAVKALTAAGDDPEGGGAEEEDAGGKAKKPAKAPADVEAERSILRMTATRTLRSAVGEIAALMQERQTLASANEEFEKAERRRLVAKLVVDAGRAPSAVWASPEPGAAPKPYLLAMSLSDLREHVAAEVAAKGGAAIRTSGRVSPPTVDDRVIAEEGGRVVSTPEGEIALKPRELEMLSGRTEADVRAYALLRIRHRNRSGAVGVSR